ncbi:hypothetical protein [Alistipes sp. An66]|uniref:hypothetical protein n=1 Tax=Alistipes sp. An66 TaxID=1965650 RepID=UPI000B366859|nr:hypothetical protein [Alistipes sp. An66]OUN60268.1 hypothetical protein B5G16_02715 [Alistipes sp. An66]
MKAGKSTKNGAGAGGNFRGNFWGNFRGNLRGVRRRTAACLAAVVAMLLAGCSSNVYLQARKRTSVSEGIPDARQLDTLCRHRMTVGAGECYDLLLGVLLGEGCLIESADKASGLVVARQVLPAEGMTVVPMAGEIRHLSFLVQPAHLTSEVRLTVYVSRQWYSGDSSVFTTEELGLSTDPEIYRSWFERLDRAVPR